MYGNALLLLLLLFPSIASAVPSLADRHLRRASAVRSNATAPQPHEYLDPTLPPLLLPQYPPACSLPLLRHDFAHTYGSPPVSVPYTPRPGCPPAAWARAVLDLSASCAGEQYDRIAAVWLDGAELLRTSTAEPTEAGVFWRVRRDVTRYSALLRRPDGGVLSVMLENVVDNVYTGVYHVNVSLDFYLDEDDEKIVMPINQVSNQNPRLRFLEALSLAGKRSSKRLELGEKLNPLYQEPADLIIPISNENADNGFWFQIRNESDAHFKSALIPSNTYRAVLEIFVSFHGDDEFWYSNPPNAYIQKNNLTTRRGNGALRQVYAMIDGRFVGSVVPFPVIFTGGINPLFWEPVVAIGAFDLPTYNLELTPFLGLLLDGKPHDFGLGVIDGIDFWLIDANLHLWLDPSVASVKAKLITYQAPALSVSRSYKFNNLNGTFSMKAKGGTYFSGWVNSSLGNLTTHVNEKLKFKSLVEFKRNGNFKVVNMKAKAKTGVQIRKDPNVILAQTIYKSKYPLLVVTSTVPKENDTYISRTNLSHTLHVQTAVIGNGIATTALLIDRQDADGCMLVQDHSVLSGTAGTRQSYWYQDSSDCYSRKISARDGALLMDNSTTSCVHPW